MMSDGGAWQEGMGNSGQQEHWKGGDRVENGSAEEERWTVEGSGTWEAEKRCG